MLGTAATANGAANGSECAVSESIAANLGLRIPIATDGPAVSALVSACPPLDENSRYCNLLQCTDFSETCTLAEANDKLVGWVSGYIPPNKPSTLFIWQVAVHPDARGLSLGKRMILDILGRRACVDVEMLRTTVTPENDASRGMFHSLARTLEASMREKMHFESERHFQRRQESEHLITIDGFDTADL